MLFGSKIRPTRSLIMSVFLTSSSFGSRSVPWLVECLSMLFSRLPISLSSARRYSSNSNLVRLSNVSLVSSRSFPFVGFPGGDTWLARILLTCLVQVHFPLLACPITPVTFVFSLPQMFVFLSRYVTFNIRLSIFICAAISLLFAWLVSAHISALEL